MRTLICSGNVPIRSIETTAAVRSASGFAVVILFFCVSHPFSLPLVVSESTPIEVVVGALATAWWVFIGYIVRLGSEGKLSRSGAILGTGLIGCICVVEGMLMTSEFLLLSGKPTFGFIDAIIYTLAAMLLLSGLVTTGYSSQAAFH